jgi:succinate-semialdehyde dehydrogenase/glutarate-semialdehyde dehydrogenase
MTFDNESSSTLPVFEKASGERLGDVEASTPATLQHAVRRANAAKNRWKKLTGDEKVASFSTLRRLLSERAYEFAELLSRENGKPLHEALLHEVVPLLDAIDWLRDTAPSLQLPESLPTRWLKHRSHEIQRRPQGVTAILSPFNFPLLIAGIDALSAIAMGCPVIIKPSEHCPLIVERFVKLANEAGLPDDILQIVHGGPKIGEYLLDEAIDAVRFTGSRDNGQRVAVKCASHLRPCTLELGGNCPLLVLDDAELERTAQAIVYGALSNSGQSCLGVGRVLVPRRLEAALCDALVPLIRQLRQGDPRSGTVELGSLTTARQLERCRNHVTQAIQDGAELLLGGSQLSRNGFFFEPTVLRSCTTNQLLYREETFGPVVPIVPYDSLPSTLASLNADPARLAAYVFGQDLARTETIAKELDYGQVVVQHVLYTYVCPELPLSGLRASGLGTVHGRDGLLTHGTPQVLSTPRLKLLPSWDFSLLDPEKAESLAKTYLSSTSALYKLTRWWKN